MIKIAPSILSSDFSRLGDEVRMLERAGADMIHIDVMDGHFVPNITIGPPVISAIRSATDLLFDVHLMIKSPDDYIDNFIDAGADIVCVHAETCTHLNRSIQRIKQRGKLAAVALNPATPLNVLDWVLKDISMVLIMTVNPGFGGQSYIEAMTDKVRSLRNKISTNNLDIDIEVDGGIALDNIGRVTEAGANVIVSGSAVFKSEDPKAFITKLRDRSYKG